MVSGIALSLFSFQEKAVLKLMDMTTDSREKQTIIMKAPTGAGKTIILIDFVDEYLSKVNRQTAFIWLCPGKGDLEEQSREKMEKFAPSRNTQNLFDALQSLLLCRLKSLDARCKRGYFLRNAVDVVFFAADLRLIIRIF